MAGRPSLGKRYRVSAQLKPLDYRSARTLARRFGISLTAYIAQAVHAANERELFRAPIATSVSATMPTHPQEITR